MNIKGNLAYGALGANKADEAYSAMMAGREKKLATGKKVAEQPSDAATLQINSKTSEVTESALENINAASSLAADVARADEMIREANRRILESADDSVLAQANQTTAVVTNLLD